jgi:hypothetical protein
LVLGNDASSLSTVIAGPSTPDPPGTPPIGSQAGWSTIGLLTSNPAGKDFVGLGLNAVGTIPNLLAPTQFVLGVNGAGTYFAKSAFKPGIGTTALGKTLLKFIGQAFMVKAAYDGIVYTGALVSCGQGSGHFTTLGDYF